MNTYVALLRGINVGGNNIIKMADLKACFEKAGFQNVSTYIQSGNVLFASREKKVDTIERKIESVLSKTFTYKAKVIVKSQNEIQMILKEVPREWKTKKDLRCYIAFLKQPLTSQQAVGEVPVKEGIDSVDPGPGVLYMSTLLSGLTKSRINKVIQKKIYQEMTIRNYNTTKKIAERIEAID